MVNSNIFIFLVSEIGIELYHHIYVDGLSYFNKVFIFNIHKKFLNIREIHQLMENHPMIFLKWISCKGWCFSSYKISLTWRNEVQRELKGIVVIVREVSSYWLTHEYSLIIQSFSFIILVCTSLSWLDA